jgi:hypothetical protein
MIQKIKRKLLPLVLAGGLALGGNIASAQDTSAPKLNASLTRIESQESQINRAEIMARDLPFNSDIYALLEDYGEGYFNKYRLQSVPLKTDNLGLGLAVQHKSSSFFEPYNQIGLVGRLQGCPTKKTFGKIDLRYFPKEQDLGTYAFLDTPKLYFDVLAGYNLDSHSAYVVPGVDWKLHKNFSLGLEGSFSGEGKLEKDYVGIRAKLNF